MKGSASYEDDRYKDFTREQLVEEYLTIRLATLVDAIGVDWHYMPRDVSQSPEYWKSIDGNLHEMHLKIAELYHISRFDCLWLDNMVDSTNLYLTDRMFKPLVRDSIKMLEEAEAKKMAEGKSKDEKTVA